MKALSATLIFCVFICIHVNAQEVLNTKITKRIYTTKKLIKVPVIDGYVSDEAWNEIVWSTDFTEKTPDEGTDPAYQTKFKVLYDDKYLYIALRAFDDEPELIQQRLSRRDGFAGDRINVIIDSYHDKRTAFVFTTTAAGVKGEEIATQNGDDWDASWNPIWYTDAKVDDQGWTAEMKIPFSQLRFGKAKEQIWGFNINRTIFRFQERSLWQRIPNKQSGFISEAGELHGLIDLVPQKQLEIQPFTVLQYDNYPAEIGNPFRDGSDFKINGGLDAKIGITNDLTLDLTINPDFGQVEADPGAIALDGFQIFFKEQRPFFVENKNIFDFEFANGSDNLFYSRRIGRNPHRDANLADGEFSKEPINSSILGAAKFSGKTQSGWSIGVLESVTSNEYAEIREVDGETREEIVEPLTNFIVARAQKDFNKRNSFIGGIFTATNRFLNGDFNELHTAAYTGGIDFQHNWHNRDYYIDGNIIMSHVLGSEEAITATQQSLRHNFGRVDANHVSVDLSKKSLTGSGGRFEIGKNGGGNWRYNGGYVWRSPELELNDVGFLRQTDEMIQFASLKYLWQVPTKTYRNIKVELEQYSTFDFDGNHNSNKYELQGEVSWFNNWSTEVGFGHTPLSYGTAYLRGGPRWRFADENYGYVYFGSDSSKKFSLTLGYVYGKSEEHIIDYTKYVFKMNYQPFDAFSMSLDTEFEKVIDKTQYVTQQSFNSISRYVLGEIDNQSLSTTLRLNYSFNPNVSLQFYGQPYIARGRYSNFSYVNNPTSSRFDERVHLYNNQQISENNNTYLIDENLSGTTDYSFSNPDFSFVQLRTNLVARWEYIPGSELFFVWARGGVTYDDPNNSLSQSLTDQITNRKVEDTFLIKATYRFVR
ncbi:DUF5916 domain-containing protein [uncultured Polaribacter sp.]|uniref:DUF5916 domain-containing protein n=1 Tax=uncultured Polaribacter sp. TaxID=174711 RepID=UPI0030D8C67C|tara:strand:- start:260 stop:2884 length:2625 start_codon:yes stop_codon:yes gene_type:complete